MSGVINQDFTAQDKTLAKYKETAKNAAKPSKQPNANILEKKGGWILPNMPL
jgi:hypothetical protein